MHLDIIDSKQEVIPSQGYDLIQIYSIYYKYA